MEIKFKLFLEKLIYNRDIFSKKDIKIAKKVAKELGEKILKPLNAGSFGKAYETNSGKVLKITSDEEEFHIAQKLSRNKNWMKCLINYYNVGELISQDYNYKWYILMDKVLPLTPLEKLTINHYYMDIIQYNKNYWEDINNEKKIKKIRNSDTNERKMANKLYPYIVKICKELKLHKIKETDFHSENMGWDKNFENLVLFDLGGYIEEIEPSNRKINKIKI